MHARQLAEIGGWLAISSELLARSQYTTTDDGLKYWAASKCRIQRWQSALKVFEHDLANPVEMHDPWPAMNIVIQEILISDLLTRVWAISAIQQDRRANQNELQGIGQSIYISHLELRNQALRILVRYREVHVEAVNGLDALRRRLERWTDLLLSRMEDLDLAIQFGFDEARIRDFSADRQLESRKKRREVERLLMASFKNSLRNDNPWPSANPDLNREIAAGVLAGVPSDRFESQGAPKEILLLEMERTQNDTQAMVQQLIEEEQQHG